VIRLAVRVRREQAELVLAELLELAPGGVEEVTLGESVEYAVYGAPGELPSLPDLKAAAGAALVEIATSETPDDWHERWRQFHPPVHIPAPQPPGAGRRRVPALRVRPPWELQAGGAGEAVEEIVIDPGQAFGTGAHATTRQSTAMFSAGKRLTRNQASPIRTRRARSCALSLQSDQSLAAASANAAANGVRVELRHADLRSRALWEAGADARGAVVVANLLRPLLLELSCAMPCAPAHLLAGGLLPDQVAEVSSAFTRRLGLRERERRHGDGWAAVWLSAP